MNVQKLFQTLIIVGAVVFLPQLSQAAETLTLVPNEKVCMVTNHVFDKPQLPVVYKGKTYYGCCENCQQALTEDEKTRTSTDPVTGKKVDKAKAVIAARENGSVLYFESQKTYQTYLKKSESQPIH